MHLSLWGRLVSFELERSITRPQFCFFFLLIWFNSFHLSLIWVRFNFFQIYFVFCCSTLYFSFVFHFFSFSIIPPLISSMLVNIQIVLFQLRFIYYFYFSPELCLFMIHSHQSTVLKNRYILWYCTTIHWWVLNSDKCIWVFGVSDFFELEQNIILRQFSPILL